MAAAITPLLLLPAAVRQDGNLLLSAERRLGAKIQQEMQDAR